MSTEANEQRAEAPPAASSPSAPVDARPHAPTEGEVARARPPRLLVEKSRVYTVVRWLCRMWLLLLHRLRVEGAEHPALAGACLIVANHQSFADIPAIAVSTRRHVCFVARDTLAKSRAISFLLRHTGAVLVKQGVPDRAAIREILEHLAGGDAVAIFPEGTRSVDGKLGEFHRGSALVARAANVPIVPCGIEGTRAILPRGAYVPRAVRCTVRFGAPIPPGEDALGRARLAILELAGLEERGAR